MANYNNDNEIVELIAGIIGFIGLIIFIVLIGPFLNFWCGYFGGWIAKIIIGDPLCRALNVLFDTNYFVKDMLPWIGGALGWIGHFFKSTSTKTSTNSKKKF